MKNAEYLLILERLRWNGKPCCPYCDSLQQRKLKGEQRYQCNECYTSYSVTVNTLFHQTHIDLEKWFVAIRLVLMTDKSISVRELAKNSM